MAYTPVTYQGSRDKLEDILQWAEREFAAVGSSFFNLDMLRLVAQYVAPDKPRNGDIRYADGTHFNPTGGGEGFYGYYAGAWHKLG